MDKRRSTNPVLRVAVGFAVLVVLISMLVARSHSLNRSDGRALAEQRAVTDRKNEREIAEREARAEAERAAIARIVELDMPVYCAGRKPYAALTFDDGPGERTPELVRTLRRAGIPATFFVLGRNGDQDPERMRLLTSAGVLMNHSWAHPDMRYLNRREIRSEILDTQRLIREETGQDYKGFRAPYGARDDDVNQIARRMRFAQILWSADTEDALRADAKTIGQKAIDGLGPGAIVLMHDGPADTIKALKEIIIPRIKKTRLQMVTIPELLAENPPSKKQLQAGGEGCRHAGKINVSGTNKNPHYMRRNETSP